MSVTSMSLYPFQREAIDSLYSWFYANSTGNPLLVLPTGGGKSIIIASLIKEAIEQWPNTRILMLTHVKELVVQNAIRLDTVWPDAPLGIYMAGLKKFEYQHPIVFASIQSVYNKAKILGHFDLVIIDEAHLVSNKAQGIYRDFLYDLTQINPNIRVIGLTATPYRFNGSIIGIESGIFTDIAYEVKLLNLIQQGYLAPLISNPVENKVNCDKVEVRKGEYVTKQLEVLLDKKALTNSILNEIATYAKARKHWLVFCVSIEHANHVLQAILAKGYTAACITSETEANARDRDINLYRKGNIQVLVTVGVLTTGFDAPETDLLVMLRPTQSVGLYVQMCGRGMRTAPGKENCLVLDFAGNIDRHGPIDLVVPPVTKNGNGNGHAPTKKCICGESVPISVRVCPQCNNVFEFNNEKIQDKPSLAPILSSDGKITYPITECIYYKHTKLGSPYATLRVEYLNKNAVIAKEWICLEHQGPIKNKAKHWWQQRTETTIPNTVDEAMQLPLNEILKIPKAITIKSGKFPEIVGYQL